MQCDLNGPEAMTAFHRMNKLKMDGASTGRRINHGLGNGGVAARFHHDAGSPQVNEQRRPKQQVWLMTTVEGILIAAEKRVGRCWCNCKALAAAVVRRRLRGCRDATK